MLTLFYLISLSLISLSATNGHRVATFYHVYIHSVEFNHFLLHKHELNWMKLISIFFLKIPFYA